MRVERYKKIKYCAYALILLGLFILQTARGMQISIFGARPDYMIFFIAILGMYEGPYPTAIYGFVGGLMLSTVSMPTEGLLAIYYGLFGLLCGYFSEVYLRKVFFWPAIVGSFGILLRGLIGYVFYYWLAYGAGLWLYLEGIVLKMVISAPFSFLLYAVISRIHKHFSERQE